MITINKYTIYDIASKANVSVATVSRVLNKNPNVSMNTRQRVLEIVKETKYMTRPAARSLVSTDSQTFGILTYNINVPHYAATAHSIERELLKHKINSFTCSTGGLNENNLRCIDVLACLGVSGIICIGSVFTETLQNSSILSDYYDMPFILVHCSVDAPNTSSIIIDEQRGMNLAVEKMIEGGHRHLFYVKDADTYSGRAKKLGFINAMKKNHLCSEDSCVIEAARGINGGKEAAKRILNSGNKFDGIIFGDDSTAIGGMKYLDDHGYSVPRDVAIIGCYNSISARCTKPTLTSIDYNIDIIGKLIVAMLDEILNGEIAKNVITITPKLAIREST